MAFYLNSSPAAKLDVAALDLEGRDLEIAQIIAEETEAEREIRFAALPPISEEEASSMVPGPLRLFLPGPPITLAESRRLPFNEMPWDALLRGGETVSRCATRAGLSHVAVIEFAIDTCRPSNWEALFWYQQWLSEVVAVNIPWKTVVELVALERERLLPAVAASERKRVAGLGGAGKAAKYEPARLWLVEQWRKEGASWNKKEDFAEAYQELIEQKFGVKPATSTITDVWLSPARLAGN